MDPYRTAIASIFHANGSQWMTERDFIRSCYVERGYCSPSDGLRLIRYAEEQHWIEIDPGQKAVLGTELECLLDIDDVEVPLGFQPELRF